MPTGVEFTSTNTEVKVAVPTTADEISHSSAGMLSTAEDRGRARWSQFFITCAPCPWLDSGHVVFGKVDIRYWELLFGKKSEFVKRGRNRKS